MRFQDDRSPSSRELAPVTVTPIMQVPQPKWRGRRRFVSTPALMLKRASASVGWPSMPPSGVVVGSWSSAARQSTERMGWSCRASAWHLGARRWRGVLGVVGMAGRVGRAGSQRRRWRSVGRRRRSIGGKFRWVGGRGGAVGGGRDGDDWDFLSLCSLGGI